MQRGRVLARRASRNPEHSIGDSDRVAAGASLLDIARASPTVAASIRGVPGHPSLKTSQRKLSARMQCRSTAIEACLSENGLRAAC